MLPQFAIDIMQFTAESIIDLPYLQTEIQKVRDQEQEVRVELEKQIQEAAPKQTPDEGNNDYETKVPTCCSFLKGTCITSRALLITNWLFVIQGHFIEMLLFSDS